MSWLRPEWLLALPLVWWLSYWGYRAVQGDGWRQLLPPHLANKLLRKASSDVRRWHLLALVSSLSLLTIAMAGPSFGQYPAQARQQLGVRVVVLNLHERMSQTDVQPSRMAQARFSVADLLNQWPGEQVALVAYSNKASILVPATKDAQLIRQFLPLLSPEIPERHGDNLAGALQLADALIARAGAQAGQVVVISDQVSEASLRQAIDWQPQTQLTVDVIHVGDSGRESWQRLTQAFAGQVVERGHITAIAGRPLSSSSSTQAWPTARDDGLYFVWLALLPLALLVGQRRLLLSLGLVVMLRPQIAQALPSWLQNDAQQQAQWLAQQDYQRVLEHCNDPMVCARAHFELGQYQAAIDTWRQQPSIDSVFNQGVAHVALNEIDAAKKAFSTILDQYPDHQEARENLEALENLEPPEDQSGAQQDEQQSEQQSEQDAPQESGNGEHPPPEVISESGEDIESAQIEALLPPDPARLLRYRFNQGGQ